MVDPMPTVARLMTEGEFLALPEDDGTHRELIRGGLRERPSTFRGFAQAILLGTVGYQLRSWVKCQTEPRGCVVGAEALIRLRANPPTLVGVDVAYIAAESKPAGSRKAKYMDGPPVLVVEVLSPTDEYEDFTDKIAEYLDAGVPIVWVVDPSFSTVTVYRPDAKPQLFNADQEITAEPHLPGLRFAVAELFEDLED
jgi:Uma2 family endonuclease